MTPEEQAYDSTMRILDEFRSALERLTNTDEKMRELKERVDRIEKLLNHKKVS